MKFFARLSRPGSNNPRRVKLQIDHLEHRLTPSAFGPTDGAYIVESWNGVYNDVKIQPADQKIVAAGVTGAIVSSTGRMTAARYDALGNTDSSYGVNGVFNSFPAGTDGQGLALQADGKAIVSGWQFGPAPNGSKHFVARIKLNGTLDNTYGSGGYSAVDFDPTIMGTALLRNSIALQSSGKAIMATDEGGAIVARFTTNGALDSGKNGFGTVVQNKAIGYTVSTFGNNGNYFNDLLVQPDDKVVVVGTSTNDGNGGFLVARYTANGALDSTFNGSGYTTLLPAGSVSARAYGIARQSDGKVVVVGSCTESGATTNGPWDLFIARFNANGSVDTSFGGGNGYVTLDIDGNSTSTQELGRDLVIQPDGKIVAVGTEFLWNEALDNPRSILVARFNADGTPDSTFGDGGYKLSIPSAGHSFTGLKQSVALQSNGNIIVAGADYDGTNSHPMLMRFFSTPIPLNAASTPKSISNQTLTQAQIAPLLSEAITRWKAAGVNTTALKNINLQIADLPGTTLGQAQGNTITLDNNAAGWGWFVDKTPRSDSEYRTHGNQGEQGRMDLLTVLQHEVGHMLGVDHQDAGVMADTLFAGIRHSPTHSMNLSGYPRVDLLSIINELQSILNRKHR